MQQKISLKLLPAEAADDATVMKYISSAAGQKLSRVSGFRVLKKSIDARGQKVLVNLTVNAFIDEPTVEFVPGIFHFQNVKTALKKTIIIGAGPAGLFAALMLLEKGIKPVILERGKDVRARRRDLAKLNKEGIVNPESNYCFGEGGAGTYSDGKLYTRSNKRGDIDRILNLFIHFGATHNIASDAHPHIGTNKLPQIITAMHQKIIECGGEIHFEKKVEDLIIKDGKIAEVKTADGDRLSADAFILATGHSARDIFHLFTRKNLRIEPKPFAMGVRIEHPQQLIDSIQYRCSAEREQFLPPASYSLVQQVNERGVFSFCMCPGGIIAPAATDPGELVVNGWSPSKRNNPFANSGMVVQTEMQDAVKAMKPFGITEEDPLIFMKFQQLIEQKAYQAGGGNFAAPAQRMQDFTSRKLSASLPENSYLPGLTSACLDSVLPPFIYDALAEGFKAFGKKMKGYYTNEAAVVAVESRTSSPVRIPRDPGTLSHPQLSNLYPCGEGAGYAGGIVSAAMDGERVAALIAQL
ncbi:MAG: FAD-dependent protein [Ferruginibacter sp.]